MGEIKRITEEDIKGSVPGDAYSFMNSDDMKIDESHGVSCGYCKNVAYGLRPAYKHYTEVHKDIWQKKINSFNSEKKVGKKLIKRMADLENTPEEERHVINQCSTNKNICIIDFDVLVKKKEVEEEKEEEEVSFELNIGRINKEDIDSLNVTLRAWLALARKKEKEKKEKEKEHMHSQNVGDTKLPNIIKKLLSEDAESVIVKNNKLGNFEVKYTKKKEVLDKEEKKKEDDLFNIESY